MGNMRKSCFTNSTENGVKKGSQFSKSNVYEKQTIDYSKVYPLKMLQNQSNIHLTRGVQVTLGLSTGGYV